MKHDTWHKLTQNHQIFDDGKEKYIIFRGVKITQDLTLYDTSTDYYKIIPFVSENLVETIGDFKKSQYIREVDAVSRHIRNEVNNKRNHRKLDRLKTRRVSLMSKFANIRSELNQFYERNFRPSK